MTADPDAGEPIAAPTRRTVGWQVVAAATLLLTWNGLLAWLAFAR